MSPSSWSLSTAAAVIGLERLARRKSEAGVTGTLPDLSARPYAFVRTTDPCRARATAPPGMFHFDMSAGMTCWKLSSGVTPWVPLSLVDWQPGQPASAKARARMRVSV